MEDIADVLAGLTAEQMDQLMELIYTRVDKTEYNQTLSEVGLDVSGWCKKKHPPAG